MGESRIIVRVAGKEDADAVLRLIRELAEYERLRPPDTEAEERLREGLLSDPKRVLTLIAEVDGKAAGYAVCFEHYSTFEGLSKLYLEDIFVREEQRGSGAGLALMREVAREAVRRGCFALEWEVLRWNRLAIDFYERLGATRDEEWWTYRLGRKEMERLTGEEDARKDGE